jgi:hypothetical protein
LTDYLLAQYTNMNRLQNMAHPHTAYTLFRIEVLSLEYPNQLVLVEQSHYYLALLGNQQGGMLSDLLNHLRYM